MAKYGPRGLWLGLGLGYGNAMFSRAVERSRGPGRWPLGKRLAAVCLVVGLLTTADRAARAQQEAVAWTGATPERVIERCFEAARAGGDDALARLVLASALSEAAPPGQVHRLLESLVAASPELGDQARWLARRLAPAPLGPSWPGLASARMDVGPDRSGLVRSFLVLGPFEDTGGGLARREGPESPRHDYLSADYSWGAYTVRYRRSLPESATARGLDLDLYVHPRKESCTYLESVVELAAETAAAGMLQLHLAATGAVRLRWDGVDVVTSEELHPSLVVDRALVGVPAQVGEHLLTVKVCTGALLDDGRVRVRFTDRQFQPVPVVSSSDPGRLRSVAARLERRRPGAASVGAERHLTLLERGVAPGESATRSRVLVAGVLRTLGGAEDLRSSRAPGLLDRVVADIGVQPDELAMAGFLSTSGANRTGWLRRAFERASAAGDVETASFAQRTLVEWRLRTGTADWADATAQQPPLALSSDPHARLLRALVLAHLGGSGVRQAALDRLRAMTGELGAATPLGVWRAIAKIAAGGPASIRFAARQQLASGAPDNRGPQYLKALSMFGAEAVERAAWSVVAHQRSTADLVGIGELLLEVGRYDGALEAFRLAAELSPNRVAAARGLARAELAAAKEPEAATRARGALSRAKQLEPQDAELGAELAFRQPAADEGAGPGDVPEDERFIVPAEQFLARARAKPAKVDEQFERQLHFRRVVRLHPDKRVSQLIHYAREIVVEPRTEGERYEHIPALSRHTELIFARLHRADGTVLPPEEQETPSLGLPSVRWPKLVRGDVVEVALRAWTPGPIGRRGEMPFYFVDFVGSADTRPVLYNEVVIDAPDGGPLAFDVINGKPDRTQVERRGGRTITQLIWDDPPRIPDEPFSPPASELLPVVVGSGFKDWDTFLEWYRGAVEGFTEPDEQIRRLAAELTQRKGGRELSREEKVKALFEFVADDIRYVNYVSGEWWLPNRPQQLLARRQGDCDDKAMLLISLLKAVGIDAVEALIQTRLTSQPSILQSQRVAIPMFDHGIIYLPGPKGTGGRFLDATNPETRVGPVPSMDAGAMALLVPPRGATQGFTLPAQTRDASGRTRVMPTPVATAADHGIDAEWSLSITADGEGELRAEERHVGDAALLLRTNLRQPDTRAQWVEQNLLAGWLPTVEMEPEVTFDGDLAGGAAKLEYRARSRLLARREGKDLLVSMAPPMPLTARLAPLPSRQLPVMLPPMVAPRHHHLRVRLEAPAGFRFAELPPDSEADGQRFGLAKQSFVRAPGRGPKGGQLVVLSRQVAIDQSRISVAEYSEWRRWLQRIDRMLQHGVRLTRQ